MGRTVTGEVVEMGTPSLTRKRGKGVRADFPETGPPDLRVNTGRRKGVCANAGSRELP